jgi:DNA modification methylase
MGKGVEMIIHGDCLEEMKTLDDNSIDAVITDPPYNIGKADWDKIPNYIDWCIEWLNECARVTKDNGCLYFFHNDMAQVSKLMVEMEKRTPYIFRQFIVWNKRFEGSKLKNYLDGYVSIDMNRNYKKMAEYCLYYTFQDETGLNTVMLDTNNFSTLREYFKELQDYIGVTKKVIMDEIGQRADHCFRWKSTQWDLPTAETYQELINVFNIDEWQAFYTYEDLRLEYESLRLEYEDLRYTFNNQKTHHSVWNYEIAKSNGHITPKPVPLIENIIRHSTNVGDLVLDPFAGSGTTGIACENLNRKYILIEKEAEYIDIINKRMRNHQPRLI